MMTTLFAIQWVTYGAFVFSALALIYRATRIARLPVHLRWELYPVPHEKGKNQYGGSYLEEYEWWTKPRETSFADELKEMGQEIFFNKSLFQKNRGLWIFSYPFHAGLYLLIGFAVLLLIGAVLETAGAGAFSLLQFLTTVAGAAGILLILFGTIGLLLKRMFDRNLRSFTVPADYFNLLVLLVMSGSMFLAWRRADPQFQMLHAYVSSLFSATPFLTTGWVTAEILTVLFFLIYLPFSHMTHFIAKYFTYHQIRWNDEPYQKDGKLARKLEKNLHYPVSWSAPHIKGDGKKTWVDVATNIEEKDDDK